MIPVPATVPRTRLNPLVPLWKHRELLWALTRRDLAQRYRGTVLGFGWTLLQPLVMLLLYTFVFSVVLRVRFGNVKNTGEFALYVFCGMLPWLAFSEAVGSAAVVITGNSNFVKKVLFPLEILPAKLVLAALVGQLTGTTILLAGLAVAHGSVPSTALLTPLLLVPQLAMTMAGAWFVASLGVYVRDINQAVSLVLTAWMFATPIFYPPNAVPESLAWILRINPAALLVAAYRDLLIEGAVPEALPLVLCTIGALAATVAGFAWFDRTRRSFADVL